ncbi:methylglyoxal synthase [Candidatus Riflebacteria bacterium]
MKKAKNIALIAHDNRKKDMVEWVEWNYKILIEHKLFCTGTTGKLVKELLKKKSKTLKKKVKIRLKRFKSGPLGGDLQIGAMIAEENIDLIIFLWDPMQAQPHDVDVKALLRIATVYNIPMACNRSTADFLITSPLSRKEYKPMQKDYSVYINRKVE